MKTIGIVVLCLGMIGFVLAWGFPVAAEPGSLQVVNLDRLQQRELLVHSAIATILAGVILTSVGEMILGMKRLIRVIKSQTNEN